MNRRLTLFLIVLSILRAQPQQSDSQAKIAALESLRKNQLADLQVDEYQYVRQNLVREDLWKTLDDFQRARELRPNLKTAVNLCAEYLVAEQYQRTHNPDDAGILQRLTRDGQKAFRKYLDAIATNTAVPSVDSFLAEEIGRGALTVPRRNRYGTVQVDSTPHGADVNVDDDSDVAGTTRILLIVMIGQHEIHCAKKGFRSSTVRVVVQSGKTATAACAMAK
jgi:hypothetical protein